LNLGINLPFTDGIIKGRHSGGNRSPEPLDLPEPIQDRTGFRLSPE